MGHTNNDWRIQLFIEGDARCAKLGSDESLWRELQPFLASHGYALRRRYQPDWVPSWRLTGDDLLYCEDALYIGNGIVIDAWSMEAKQRVNIKRVEKNRYGLNEKLTSEYVTNIQDPRKRAAELLDVLDPGPDYNFALLVTPLLHHLWDIQLVTVGEALDAVIQLLDGLLVLHLHNISHRDICESNIMVRGDTLYPSGRHPKNHLHSPDYRKFAPRQLRVSDVPIKYAFIDFGHSHHFPSFEARGVVRDRRGQYKDAPEYQQDGYIDPFRLDIWCLGFVFRFWILASFPQLVPVIGELVTEMMQDKPDDRPTAEEAVRRFRELTSKLKARHLRQRLRDHDEDWFWWTVRATSFYYGNLKRLLWFNPAYESSKHVRTLPIPYVLSSVETFRLPKPLQ